MQGNETLLYFGKDTVEAAVSDYFKREGLSPVKRDELMTIAVHFPDSFFQMVDDFIMRTNYPSCLYSSARV